MRTIISGLSSHPRVIAAARAALDERGYGLSSVRFICGTQDKHKELESQISTFLGTEDTILYGSCFDANGGLFETVLGEDDAIISDALNHASIIDGIRLCKAERQRYEHDDLNDLEAKLQATQGKRLRMIATDGVFSMDGDIAPRRRDLRSRGEVRRARDGRRFARDRLRRQDRARLGGAARLHGHASISSLDARQGARRRVRRVHDAARESRSICCAIARGRICSRTRSRRRSSPARSRRSRCSRESTALRDKLEANTQRFRAGMTAPGFAIRPGTHPIAPVMLDDAKLAAQLAQRLLDHGIYVIGFSFPVVPKGQARIRVQISAAHSTEDIDRALGAFVTVSKSLGAFLSATRED